MGLQGEDRPGQRRRHSGALRTLVGMVAAAEKYDVAAFLIYNDNTKVGILAQKP
jgi:hypothetical protein